MYTFTISVPTKKDFLLIIRINLELAFNNNEDLHKMQIHPVKLQFQIQGKDKSDPEVMASKPDIMFVNMKKVNLHRH